MKLILILCTVLLTSVHASDVVFQKDIAYVDGKDRDPEGFHTLDICAPVGAKDAPVLVFIHGGAFTRTPGKAVNQGRGGPHNQGLAAQGIVVVSISYRLAPAHQWPVYMEDTVKAIAWVKANITRYGGSAQKIFVCGHSAGAQLAALTVTNDRYLKSVGLSMADIRGVIPISGSYVQNGAGFKDGTVYGNDEARARDATPGFHVHDGAPPFLLISGDTEPLEPFTTKSSLALLEKLKAAGIDATHLQVKGRDHSTIITKFATAGDPAGEAVVKFIHTHAP